MTMEQINAVKPADSASMNRQAPSAYNDAVDVSETALANKVSCISTTILVSVICVAYILEVVKGNRSMGYVLTTIALAYIPQIGTWCLFRKNREDMRIKYTTIYGFLALYTFLLFTAQNNLVFTYAIPALIVATLYNELGFIRITGGCAIAENIVYAVITIAHGNLKPQDIVSLEIQLLLLLISVGFFFAVAYTSARFHKIRISRINREKQRTEHLLQQILSVSGHISENVESVTTQMNTLNDSVLKNIDAMSEISAGTSESADAIQNQLVKTEEIQKNITSVEDAFSSMASNMQQTEEAVSQGQKLIENLRDLAASSETAGNDVAAALESLQGYTNQMNSITDLITSVASQTSLLALNASIEAARAGEAGKGFAVVASEISNLAGQTTSATENIVSLIGNISNQLQIMITTANKLITSNQEQNQSAGKTAETFEIIGDKITNINARSQELSRIVTELASANKTIVSSIETISAITEEVSAHTNETYQSSERSREIVQTVNDLVSSLNEDSRSLQSAEHTSRQEA